MDKEKFYNRIEDMPQEELEERIKDSMTKELTYKEESVKIKPIPYHGGITSWIRHAYEDEPELQARCPMTGIKDLYKVAIEYIPDKLIPELKSLKFYFYGYENLPISHEHITARIFKDFMETIKPLRLRVKVWVAPRGEITTEVAYDSTHDETNHDKSTERERAVFRPPLKKEF